MFNVEPQEQWDANEAAEFDKHAADDLKKTLKVAGLSGGMLVVNILCVVPFSYGHSLHRHWEMIGKYLVMIAMGVFLWFVLSVAFVWSSWKSARETKREFGDPLY